MMTPYLVCLLNTPDFTEPNSEVRFKIDLVFYLIHTGHSLRV